MAGSSSAFLFLRGFCWKPTEKNEKEGKHKRQPRHEHVVVLPKCLQGREGIFYFLSLFMTNVAQDQQVLCGWHVHSHCFLCALEGYFAHVKTKVLAVAICWYIVNYSQHNALVTLFFFNILPCFLFFFLQKKQCSSVYKMFSMSRNFDEKKGGKRNLRVNFVQATWMGFPFLVHQYQYHFFLIFFFEWEGKARQKERDREACEVTDFVCAVTAIR